MLATVARPRRHSQRRVNLGLHPWPRPECSETNLTLAGELCTPKDVLARDVPVARARIGDLVCFLMAGAYGWDISHHDFLCHAHPERIYLNEAGA